MCDSKQKMSYEHGSDFERLPRYGLHVPPDLTPLYFCLWGWLKGEVYRTKVDTRADLLARINNACVHIKDRRHELRRATRSTLQRVHKFIEVGGGFFENLL